MNSPSDRSDALDWSRFTDRYHQGEWRAPIFRDLILADLARLGEPCSLTLLDIGCGKGFDDDVPMQQAIAAQAGRYVGVEPDEQIELAPGIETAHRCSFEDAPITPASIDVAFAVMVLEHLETPQRFWDKLHEVLRDGGVFWGFTIDSRHWFSKASLGAKKLKLSDWYLDRLYGKRGEERYENYPVHYRSNTPAQIDRLARNFSSRTYLNFHRIGQMDYYLPRPLRRFGRMVDRAIERRGGPGGILAVRAVK